MNPKYEYKGFQYLPWEDHEDDNVKIFHDVATPAGRTIHMDWSPYDTPSEAEFQLWIDLGLPGRISQGPLDSADLDKIAGRDAKVIELPKGSDIGSPRWQRLVCHNNMVHGKTNEERVAETLNKIFPPPKRRK